MKDKPKMEKKLGQHFVIDDSILQFEAESAEVLGKKVLEIGAGDGRLTSKLLSCGAAHITAVELDRKLATLLRKKFHHRVTVIEKDFLSYEPSSFNCIVGNIPYYITSKILFKIAKMSFDSALLCVQKEVAERLTAMPGENNYGRLTVSCRLIFDINLLAMIDRSAFYPVPKVDSALIKLEKTGFVINDKIEKNIGALFSHRKKSVANSIFDSRQAIFGTNDKKFAKEACKKVKYSTRKVLTLSPFEALEVAKQLV